MAGLIESAGGKLPPPRPAAAAPGAPVAPGAAPEADESNPAYQAAMKIAMQALYGAGGAKDVAKAIQSASDPAEGLADTAYEMVSIADEKTQGQVPDELLVSLATEILGEVADIAQAAGIEVKGAMIATAMRSMLLRYVTEQGMDASQLQQAMADMDPQALGAALDKMEA